MRIKFCVALFTATLATSSYAASDACEDLAKAVSISLQGLPEKIAAGDELKFAVKAKILNQKILENWKDVTVYIAFSNGIAGSHPLDFDLQVKDDGIMQATEEVKSDLMPMNMAGTYQPIVSIFGLRGNPSYCAERVLDVQSTSIEVTNTEEDTDVFPPLPSNFASDKASYVAGETIVISFDAEDKSGVCTKDLEDQKNCKSVPHVELTNLDGGRDINFFSAPIIRNGNRYQVSFTVPKDTDAGAYELTIVNIYDLWQNAFAHLLDNQRIRIKILP